MVQRYEQKRRLQWYKRGAAYIPNPYGRDLGLGYRVRTLPQGRDRWGIYSTAGRLHPLVPEEREAW